MCLSRNTMKIWSTQGIRRQHEPIYTITNGYIYHIGSYHSAVWYDIKFADKSFSYCILNVFYCICLLRWNAIPTYHIRLETRNLTAVSLRCNFGNAICLMKHCVFDGPERTTFTRSHWCEGWWWMIDTIFLVNVNEYIIVMLRDTHQIRSVSHRSVPV